jgi:hypothetical protein
MEINTRQPKNTELFDTAQEKEEPIRVRQFDPSTAEGELRLRLSEVSARIAKLEKAQEISQELLESTISV